MKGTTNLLSIKLNFIPSCSETLSFGTGTFKFISFNFFIILASWILDHLTSNVDLWFSSFVFCYEPNSLSKHVCQFLILCYVAFSKCSCNGWNTVFQKSRWAVLLLNSYDLLLLFVAIVYVKWFEFSVCLECLYCFASFSSIIFLFFLAFFTWNGSVTVKIVDLEPIIFNGNKSFMFYTVDLMKPETTVIIRNAKIDMFKGSMRLAVDKWGRVEATEPAKFVVKKDNNLSLVEYELVNVVEEWLGSLAS